MKKSSIPSHWWDWTSILLLFILLETLATRLVSTSWTPFLYLVQMYTSMAFVIGIILGYSRFRSGVARWLSFFYLLLLVPLQWTLVIDQRVSLEEQLSSVWGRLYFSARELIAQRPVDDPFFFVAVMSVAFWIVSASAGFSLTRHQNYLRTVIPSAIGILVIQHYDNTVAGRVWFLAFFTFVALLLLGRLYLLQNQVSWRARRVLISAENRFDLIGGMAALAALVILASFTVPATRSGVEEAVRLWNRVTHPWQEFTEKMENAVSALDAPGGSTPGEFYGTELPLGRGFPLSDAVMFEVKIPDIPAQDEPPRFYWRGRTYDYFIHGQWYTTGTVREGFSPKGEAPLVPNTDSRSPYSFAFKVGETRFSLLYGPEQPVWVSRPGSFLAAPAGDGKDIFSWNASPALLPGETYQVQAVLNNPNIQQLREAGTDYPQWVKDKYLQLPDGFSQRITTLANDIAASQTDPYTPYDAAVAITKYLRDSIEYSQTIPAAPKNRDPVEWVLFDYKKAYCVYYATSEVLMLRSLGIPARLAVGFSEGAPSTTRPDGTDRTAITTYTILKKNAHAWPEVYFPGIGWVEFEPTGNQAALSRPLPPVESQAIAPPSANVRNENDADFAGRNPVDEEGLTPDTAQETPVNPSLYLIPSLIAAAALGLFLSRRYNLPELVPVLLRSTMERNGGKAPAWVIRWEQWTLLSPIERAFEAINSGLRQLKQPAPVHSTPSERARALSGLLPHLDGAIKILLDEHQTSLYTSRTADAAQARRAARNIRMQVLLARIRRFFTGTYAVHT